MLKDRARWMEVLSVLLVWGGLASCASPKPVLDAETSPPRLENLVEVQPAELPGKGEAEKPTEMTLVQPSLELRTSSVDQPRYSLSGRDVDLKTLLLALSQEIDRNIVVDPSIAETVTVDLKQVTLEEALDGLLHPLNLQYGVKEDVIYVQPKQMATRIFRLNYIISRRRGLSNLQAVSGQGTADGTSLTSGSSLVTSGVGTVFRSSTRNPPSTSSVESSEETDIWREIFFGLRQIVTGGPKDGDLEAAEFLGPDASSQSPHGGPHAETRGSAAEQAFLQGESAPEEANGQRSYFTINRQSGIIIVRDYPEALMKVAEFLEAVEGSVQRQVFIQAKIIEVSLNDNYQLGIDWSEVSPLSIQYAGGGNLNDSLIQGAMDEFVFGVGNARFTAVIDALSQQGDVSVLSSPKIATLNNQRALIKVGTEDIFFIPEVTPATTTTASTTEFIPSSITIGIVLDVLPQINENGEIMMSINTSITEKTDERVSPDGVNVVPVLDVRESNNVVLARDGQTIVIGGLMKTRKEKNQNALPVLGDIPLLGNLFHRIEEKEEKSELVIMLTPEVMVGMAVEDRLERARERLRNFGYYESPDITGSSALRK